MSQVNEAKQLTNEEVELLAQDCSEQPEAYRKFVRDLTSPPETYNLHHDVLGGLIEALHRLTPASLELDHFKRVLTYGEKLRINPPAREHGLNPTLRGALANQLDNAPLTDHQRARLLLIHGLLGKMTEALELAPILVSLLADNKDFDPVNLLEELGDDAFYEALVEQACGYTPGQVAYRNVKKLGKRYKGGVFTRTEAVNRDLVAERVALGAEDNLIEQ